MHRLYRISQMYFLHHSASDAGGIPYNLCKGEKTEERIKLWLYPLFCFVV